MLMTDLDLLMAEFYIETDDILSPAPATAKRSPANGGAKPVKPRRPWKARLLHGCPAAAMRRSVAVRSAGSPVIRLWAPSRAL